MNSHDICILGGGVSGISSALVLQAIGLNPVILTDAQPRQNGDPLNSLVPTNYAMASAYPHNLRVQNLEQVSDDSQAVFEYLASRYQSKAGVQRYSMYEVFEHEPDPAPLADRRIDFTQFEGTPSELKRTLNPPARAEAPYVWGWKFDTYFADMPNYLPFLWDLFEKRGGRVERLHISADNLREACAGRPAINCLGLGSLGCFQDEKPALVVRGRQVIVKSAPPLKLRDSGTMAYNYTPAPEVFSRADGTAEYVHFFPRSDGWVLGQTREHGAIGEDGKWHGDAVNAPEVRVGFQSVPLPILQLNSELLQSWLNVNFDRCELSAREGFRYYRDPTDDGVRLEFGTEFDLPLIHNYGHGGSGVTMSWGCAIRCAELAIDHGFTSLSKRQNADGFDNMIFQLLESHN